VDVLIISGNPTFGSVSPSFAYVGSTVTIRGTNFISSSQTCSAAKIGSTPALGTDAAFCAIVSSTEITVVVGSGTALGAAGIYIAMSNLRCPIFLSADNVLSVIGNLTLSSVYPGISPSSGHIGVSVYGRNTGLADMSGRARFGTTSGVLTHWRSDTLIFSRISSGVGLNLTVSSTTLRNSATWLSGMSYRAPSPINSATQRLSNISIEGANFGSSLAVVQRTTTCSNITIPSHSSFLVCNSSDLSARGAAAAVTEAVVSLVFSDVSRLDDVIVSLRSPQGIEYTLMQNKCYGTLPCGPSIFVAFDYQIFPVGSPNEVPLVKCPSSGTYFSNEHDANMLRLALSSSAGIGDWSLRVSAGSQFLNISRASLFFKTKALDIEIGNSSVSSLEWFSDSSLSIKAPGYLNSSGLESSSGWGRNHSVLGLSSGLTSPSSCVYSYPNPSIINASGAAAYSTSGSTNVLLVGRFFSNVDSKPGARMGVSICAITRWSSDTAVACTQAPSLRSIQSFVLTLQISALAVFNASVLFSPAQSFTGNATSIGAVTAAWNIPVGGAGFGVWDSSVRLRLSGGFSSAGKTLWTCDTHIIAKVFVFHRNVPGVIISLASIAHNISSIQVLERPHPAISSSTSRNFPSTGSSIISVSGADFGRYSTSMRASIANTGCQSSSWVSDSSICCKLSAGLGNSSSSMSLTATFAAMSEKGSSVILSYDVPAVNISGEVVVNNSIACFFNSSGCSPGHLIQLIYGSSGFGTSAQSLPQLSVVQGSAPARRCDNISWFSDSSMHCLFNHALSPEFFQIRVIVGTTGAQLPVKNPTYIQAPPLLNNKTVQFRIYKDALYPENQDLGFREYGSTTNFVFGESSFVGNVQHSEIVNFGVLAFLDAPQYFLDASFSPVETIIHANITVWNVSDVTSLISCDASSSKKISFTLPSRLFWGKCATSWAFCPPQNLFNVQLSLRVTLRAQNSNGTLFLVSRSPAFIVNSTGASSITFTKNLPSIMKAARLYDDAFGFRFFYGNSLDNICESVGRSRFKYSVVLICEGSVSAFRRSFFSGGFIESNQCLQNVTGMYFTKPHTNCFFNVSAGAGSIISAVSSEFKVDPGLALNAMLIGTGPNCASAGAIVWSVNSTTEGLCLVAQLMDGEGNNITSPADASVIARSETSSHADYILSRIIRNTSSDSGVIKWCEVYSGKQQNERVIFGANVNGNMVYWNSSFINVSSAGPPTTIIPTTTAALHNQTLLPGAAPLKFTFIFQDAGGNTVNRLAGVAVRVRVAPQVNATIGRTAASILSASRANGRRLLQSVVSSATSCDNTASTELPLEFVFAFNSSSSQLSVGPDFLCRAGINDIFYDIGTVSGVVFTTTHPNAFQMSVIVFSGVFQSFMIISQKNVSSVRTYELIDFLEAVFLDLGLNEVSGNVTISLMCTDTNVSLYPARSFVIKSNLTFKAVLPPCLLHVLDWMPLRASYLAEIISSNVSVPQYGSGTLAFQLNPTCFPGYRVFHPLFDYLLSQSKTNATNPAVSCARCANGTISSQSDSLTCRSAELCFMWVSLILYFYRLCPVGTESNEQGTGCKPCAFNFYKSDEQDAACQSCPPGFFSSERRDTCLTFDFKHPPLVVYPDKFVDINGISIRTMHGAVNVSLRQPMKVLVVLSKATSDANSSAIFNGNVLQFRSELGVTGPSSDFFWSLRLIEPNITDVVVAISDVFVSALDFSPVIKVISHSNVSYLGANVSFDCQSMSPESRFFMPLFTARNVTISSCIFVPETISMSAFSQPAYFTFVSASLIQLRCEPLSSGRLGLPYSVWRMRVVFPDGRESPLSAQSLVVQCPPGMYILANATTMCLFPPCCLDCPSPMSASISADSLGMQSCICQPGYWGSGGLSCKACPRNAKYGFVCTAAGLQLPLVKPGFFIDYSLMSSCTEESCRAVMKCPNPKACPGQRNRQCLQTEEECYTDASFGCTACCRNYYMENLTCHHCPQGQLPLLLGLALIALVLFVAISSSVEFPPILSVVAGMKVFITGMQSFVGIRLFDINWPPIVLQMFDFTRFFSFSVDVVRPECSLSYDPDTKLASLLIGPFVCIAFIAFMMIAYVAFKCRRISLFFQHPTLQSLLHWPHERTLKSVWSCIIVSAFCLNLSGDRLMCNGLLWNALNPSLIKRTDLLVLNQKVRRGAVVTGLSDYIDSRTKSRIPTDWLALQSAVAPLSVSEEFSRTTSRFRLMVSSAMSILLFTFQGNMEAALSTFDCTEGFLRKSPTVNCDVSDPMYVRMLAVSWLGIIMYTAVLPVAVMMTLRSRWARNVFTHDNLAYNQLVGFLTSVYCKEHKLWEIVSCLRKVVLISIPLLISKQPIVQSLSVFIAMFIYTFFILYFKPMQSVFLNKLEVLGCVSVLVGAFTSVFFVVEYEGRLLLGGSDRDFVGLLFVIICATALSLSALLVYQDFMRLFLVHRILFLKSWILQLGLRLGAAGTESAYLSLVVAAFNRDASAEIHEFKRKFRLDLENFKSKVSETSGRMMSLLAAIQIWFFKLRLAHGARQYKPSPECFEQCMKAPELETLVYLHKLSERIERWEQVSSDYWDVNPMELPNEFREVKGDADPPHAEYAYQANVIHMLEEALPAKVHRVLTGVLFSYLMCLARDNQTSVEKE
jgi:hypothetical protein